MNRWRWGLAVFSAACLTLLRGSVYAARPDEEAQSLEPQHIDEQIEQVQQALKRRPHDPVLPYNLGTLLYHKTAYEEAAESLKDALAVSRTSLQRQASYNLGNARYRQGEAREATALKEAIDLYRKALGNYRVAIQQDPGDRDAQFNYELVDRRIHALLQQQAQTAQAERAQQQREQATTLGNTHARQAQVREATAPNEALDLYQHALEHYQKALQQDPGDREAQEQSERVKQRMQALKDQQKTQPPSPQPTEQQLAQQPRGPTPQDQTERQEGRERPEGRQREASDQRRETSGQPSPQPTEQQLAQQSREPTPQDQTERQEGRQEPEGEQREASASEPSDGEERPEPDQTGMSPQQAMGILESAKREERGAFSQGWRGAGRAPTVERDW